MTRSLRQITYLIIHCSASPNGRPHTIEDIDAWHKERGFQRQFAMCSKYRPQLQHVGYHYVITLDGMLQPGRSEYEVGAHCAGMNTASIGTCLIGTDRFTDKQWATLAGHVKNCQFRYPEIHIAGHREFSNKTCPGFDVQAWLKNRLDPLPQHLLT